MACDVCSQNGFRVTRIICLSCSNGGQSSLDLCARCYTENCVRESDGELHKASHPLLQLRRVLSQRLLFVLLDTASARLEAINSGDDLSDANLDTRLVADADAVTPVPATSNCCLEDTQDHPTAQPVANGERTASPRLVNAGPQAIQIADAPSSKLQIGRAHV